MKIPCLWWLKNWASRQGLLRRLSTVFVNKKYVTRQRSKEDRRVVFLKLTEKGKRAYEHHCEYHRQMTEAVINRLDESEIPVLIKTLTGLSDFFKGYNNQINN